MKILLIHPGHTFSTSDVFDGLSAGFRAVGCDVVEFRWDQILHTLGSFVMGAAAGGVIKPEEQDRAQAFVGWVAAADATNLALHHEVDAVMVVTGTLFPPSRVAPLRKLGIPVVCYGTEAPYFRETEEALAPAYSHWFTQERKALDGFRAVNPRSFYLPMAYNPDVHQPGAADPERAVDVVFVGGGYPERKALLDGVDWTDIRHERRGTLWHLDLQAERDAADSGRRTRYAEGAIDNTETAAWHRSAAISLNLHRRMTLVESGVTVPVGSAESLGPRAYEIPAVGGFMLCDDERPEVVEVFGDSAATFRAWDAGDLTRQIRYWLRRPDARERVRRAQHEAVQGHTWAARAAQVLTTIID